MAQDNEKIKRTYTTTSDEKIEFRVSEDPSANEQSSKPITSSQSADERLRANGYNPDMMRQNAPISSNTGVNNEIGKKPNLNPQNGLKLENNTNNSPLNPKEGAPDLGKDYGESRDPSYNGYGKGMDSAKKDASPSQEIPRKDSGVQNGIPRQQQANHSGNGLENNNQLDKKNGLKKEDDSKEGKPKKEADKSGNEADNPSTPKPDEKDLPKSKDGLDNKGNKSDINPEAPDSTKKPKEQEGNGYGALKKNNPANTNASAPANTQDGTSRARRNYEHTRRMQQGRRDEAGDSKGVGLPKRNPLARGNNDSGSSSKGSLGARLKNGLRQFGKGKTKDDISEGGKGGKEAHNSFTDNIRKIGAFLAAHPHLAIVFGVIALILLILIITCIDDESGSGKRGTHCTYNLKGVSSSGEVKLEGLQVEVINCDGRAGNYTVLETVDFEKYVLGVALAEIGPDSPDEAIKAQIVAVRSFSLRRNSGMCPGNQDSCFHGYNASTGKIRMRACTNDQVYWDYEKDIYREARGGKPALYSPEPNNGGLWKSALNEERKAQVLALADDVKGKVLVESSGSVYSTNYVDATSREFINKAKEGKTYDKILAEVYTDSDGFSSGQCTSYGNIDYGDYVLSSEGHEILHQPIDTFLRSKGTSLEEFNQLIANNVDKAGFGTRAGVVAAAVTLIAELGNNYGVKVPYYWGGGHYDGVVVGALDTWGSTQCHTYANNTSYNYCGLDCSGFVPWAIKNGGFNMSQRLAGDFKNLSGARKVTLSNSAVLEPGDLLESDGHIVLVVGIDETSKEYICAEARGNSDGVTFNRRAFNSSQYGYWGVKMDGYYDASNVRSKN